MKCTITAALHYLQRLDLFKHFAKWCKNNADGSKWVTSMDQGYNDNEKSFFLKMLLTC